MLDNVEVHVLVILTLCYLVGYALKAITGFSEALPVVLIGSAFLDVVELVALLTLADLAGGWMACVKYGGGYRRDRLRGILIPMLVGNAVAAVLIYTLGVWFDALAFIVMASATTVVFVLFILRKIPTWAPTGALATGAGFAGMTTGMDGPLTSMTVLRNEIDGVKASRGDVIWLLNIVNTIRVVPVMFLGGVTSTVLCMIVLAFPAQVVGFAVGNKFHTTISDIAMRKFSIAAMTVSISVVLIRYFVV